MKPVKLPARTKLFGYDYNKNLELRMTGKEWYTYAKTDTFYTDHGIDAATCGKGLEVWLDGLNINKGKAK